MDKDKKLKNLKYAIWIIAGIWFVSDLIAFREMDTEETLVQWFSIMAVLMPAAWWTFYLFAHILFLDKYATSYYFPTLPRMMVMMRYGMLFMLTFTIIVIVAMKVVSIKDGGFVNADERHGPFPPAVVFLGFAAALYGLIKGMIKKRASATNESSRT